MTLLAKIGRISILGVAIILGFTLDSQSQKKGSRQYVSVKFGDSRQEIVDFTKTVEEKCSAALTRTVGNNSIQIRFQPEYAVEAEALMATLEQVIKETQKILSPLDIADLRIYILQRTEIPANYKMSEMSDGKEFYLHFVVFKDKRDLNTDACDNERFCSDIFGTLPHELTHSALDNFIDRKSTRWFDEGLAEYTGNRVLEIFSPNLHKKKTDGYIPLVSLYRDDIRESIFSWKEPDPKLRLKNIHKDLSNEIYRYGASYQIIKETVSEAEQKGLKDPARILLLKLKERREKSGTPSNSGEIVSLIQQTLSVDPKNLGPLDEKTQKSLVNEALAILSQNRISSEERNYALYILAGIDKVAISNDWIGHLLAEVFQQNANEVSRELAATALFVRSGQKGFDEVLKNYVSKNKELKNKSPKKIRMELEELSIRPMPRATSVRD